MLAYGCPMWRLITLGLAALISLGACKRADEDTDAAGRASAAATKEATPTRTSQGGTGVTISPTAQGSGVTIEYDPATGKGKVVGGAPLKGDPKACAAFRACCTQAEMGLMCGLTEAAGGTCESALQTARQYLKERSLKPPVGCQ